MNMSSYIGIPYVERGRTRAGLDCWGVPYLLYREVLGVDLPSYSELEYNAEDRREVADIMECNKPKWMKVDNPEPYDIVSIRMAGLESHCGVYLGDGRFIHSLKGMGTVIDRIDSARWRNKIGGYYRRSGK